MTNCQNCSSQFETTDDDRKFYARFDVPDPVECPDCRENRRIAFRNEKTFYIRNCDNCQKSTVSIYSPDKKYHVYCQTCFWGDQCDGLKVGRDYDFSRPFFEQFNELLHDAPLVYLFNKNSQNSEFTNQETDNKNCYMNAGGHYNEDCYHNTYAIWSKNCADNYWVMRSELLYQCVKCENCFSSSYLQNCENCSDSHFCYDCKSCNNCFGCIGLRHKQYHFFNEQLAPEEYKVRVREYLDSPEGIEKALHDSQRHFLKFPHKFANTVNCENSEGDDMLNCKNTHFGYLTERTEDCKHCYVGLDIKDCMDVSIFGWGEVIYNLASSGDNSFCMACSSTWTLKDCNYCFVCFNSNYLFGCVGLKKNQYCILNKQYSREEYESLLPKIIEHMKSTGEWGQFFPTAISPWGYNETVAQQYFPLTKEQALDKGYKWKDKDQKEYKPQTYTGSYNISEVSDNLTQAIFACKNCGKNYKIIEQELQLYKRQKIHLPKHCPDCRHKYRLSLRNPRTLHARTCAKCSTPIQTTYSPDRPEIVYCEKCYLEHAIT